MSGALPVAGVGLGEQTKFGHGQIRNTAWTIAPPGLDSARVSISHSVYYANQNGATVWFAFDQAYLAPSYANVPFIFGAQAPVSGASAGNQGKLGTPNLRNAARTIAPAGIAGSSVAKARAWHFVHNSGAAADFLFAASYTQPLLLNVPFYFGGDPVVTAVSVGDTSRFGSIARIKKPPQLFAAGIYQAGIGKPRVGATGSVDFRFGAGYATYETPSPFNVPMYFGAGLAVSATAGDQSKFGQLAVKNTAQSFSPKAIDLGRVGKPKAYDSSANGATVDLNFVQAYLYKPPALNTPFYFAWESRAFADGWQDTRFGNARSWLFHSFVRPSGLACAQFGTTKVENWAEFAATPVGIAPAGFGLPGVLIAPKYPFTLSAVLPQLVGFSATVSYSSLTARPTVAQRRTQWRIAGKTELGSLQAQSNGVKKPAGWAAFWQRVLGSHSGVEHHLPQSFTAMPVHLWQRQQGGNSIHLAHPLHQQDGTALWRDLVGAHEAATKSRIATRLNHQDGDRTVRSSRDAHWQNTAAYVLGCWSDYQGAKPAPLGWAGRYQEARVPPPGMAGLVLPPVQPAEACYSHSAQLVFASPFAADAFLLFQCDGSTPLPPPIGGTVIVAIQRIYIVINNCSLRRVSDNALVPTLSMSLSLDSDSWVWGFDASLPGTAQALVEPSSSGVVELSAWVNGTEFRILAEHLSRERSFGQTTIRLTGRGRHAVLDAPYAATMNFNNPEERTHQQLFGDVLQLNGVPLGWDVDYGLEAWSVPAGVFAHQGTHISALVTLAKAGGAYLIPHPNAASFKVRPLYPAAPWNWGDVIPDFVLPASAVSRESIAWSDKPSYNRVFVSAQEQGVLGQVTRQGAAGNWLAPMVTDSLITTAAAARQRGLAVLSDTGRQLAIGLRLPVLPATGIIQPGAFIQYEETGDDGIHTRLGLVRSTNIEVGLPEVFQSLGVECHA